MPRTLPCLCAVLALAAATLAAVPTTASAHRPAPQPVRLQLIDRDTGRELPSTVHRGQRWTAGEPGQRYAVRLSNASHGRVLVVLSVDGVNAISGETASPGQTGYVLGPGQSTDITGWRKSHHDVAAFHFTDPGDSYAARTGRAQDVGVIGIAVFHEQAPRPLPPPSIARADRHAGGAIQRETTAGHASAASPAAQAIGTGHGAREHAPVGTTRFVRASTEPAAVTTLRYDTRRNLLARGIRLPAPPVAWQPPREPRAFPGSFVPDPR